MRVNELAKELGLPINKLLALARAMGIEVASRASPLNPKDVARIRRTRAFERVSEEHTKPPRRRTAGRASTPLLPEELGAAPPRVAPTASPAPLAPVAAASPRQRGKGPVVAFASLKGGVGKTTMSLCVAELLRRWPPRPVKGTDPATPPPATWPVVLIDADVAGTELYWVWNEACGSENGAPLYQVSESLIDLLEERADHADVFSRLVDKAQALAQDPSPRGLIVPTFTPGTEMFPASLEWKQILELTGTYVTRVLVRIIEALRNTGCAVVVDLPAFDVGFARKAADAVREVKGQVFIVTDCDVRSLRSTQQFLSADLAGPEDHLMVWCNVVVNRASDRSWRDQFPSRLAEVAQWGTSSGTGADTPALPTEFIRPVVAESAPPITTATDLSGNPRKLFEAISVYVEPKAQRYLDDRDRRRLRGDAEPSK